jgi:OOP family OmpA-OmpF porin
VDARRLVSLPLLAAGVFVAGCASHTNAKTSPASSGGGDLIVLLPDPGTNTVGRASVSNASGSVTLEGARASTRVAPGQPPSEVRPLADADVRRSFESVLSALPQAADHFTLNFLFDSDELTPESRASVPQILAAVRKRAYPDVLILGHTDTKGTPASNVSLGLKRAEVVQKLLLESGLSASLIEIDSHGEADLLVPTADDVPEPRNRRVEITVR